MPSVQFSTDVQQSGYRLVGPQLQLVMDPSGMLMTESWTERKRRVRDRETADRGERGERYREGGEGARVQNSTIQSKQSRAT